MRVDGVTLGPEEPGSLAGPDIDWRAAQIADGDIAGHPNDWGWVAPPGNGYGFLSGPRRGAADGSWRAEWTLDPGSRLRLVMAAAPGPRSSPPGPMASTLTIRSRAMSWPAGGAKPR